MRKHPGSIPIEEATKSCMLTSDPISRREFLAASAGLAVAGNLAADRPASAAPSRHAKLALHGGEKTIQQSAKLPIRWGDPERERLNAMLGQDSLFYWKGAQTTLLI